MFLLRAFMKGLIVFFLLFVLESKIGHARSPKKQLEKKAHRIGLKINKLVSDKNKKNFSTVKKRSFPKPPPLDQIPSTFPQPSKQAQYKIVRVHNLLAKGERLVRAIPAMLPVRGRISSEFGLRVHPKTQEEKNHLGIDIVAIEGAPVFSTADGVVVFSGRRSGYGKVVVVDHGQGYQTVYAHNSRITVSAGARVKRGETIARVGSTGHTTGPHLHYEVRKNGEPIDPRPYLRPRRITL